jgi:fatty-acyl-CoA synthase
MATTAAAAIPTAPAMPTAAAWTGLSRPAPFRSHVELMLDRADTQPDRVMLSDASRQVTAQQFRRGVRNAALDLRARGTTPGCLIALAAPITLEAVLVRYAASLIGCATVVCPNATDPARLNHFLATVSADELICFPETAEVADRTRSAGVVRGIHCITHVELDTAAAAADDFALKRCGNLAVSPDALAILVTSGGTTGASKASRRTFAGWRRALVAPASPTRRQLICTPLAYIAQILLDQTLLAGGTVILRDGFEPSEVLRTIEVERVTHLCLVEPRLVELADHPDVRARELSSLMAISHIGADAAPSLRRRLQSRLGPVLAHSYGASEAGLISLLGPTEYGGDGETGRGSAGRVLPDVEVRIVPAAVDRNSGTGTGTGAGTVGGLGLISVRSAGVARGYAGWCDSSAFRADGWYDSGDCGFLDSDGYLHVRGRTKDERFIEGISTFPVDIQEALCALPDVAYAVAIPAADCRAGFDALVVLRKGSPSDASALRAQLTRGGEPGDDSGIGRGINQLVVTAEIPVTEQGKPDRRAIRVRLDA